MRAVVVLVCIAIVFGIPSLAPAPWTSAGAAAAVFTAQGTIDSIERGMFTVTSAEGTHLRVKTAGDTFVLDRLPAKLEDITVGDYIGVAAQKEADGALTAVSINIFAPALRGRIREGQFPMETGNIMTNAVVTQYVSRVAGRTVSLTFKEGTATITVPPSADIHRLVISALGDLRVGMRVTVRGSQNADGTVTASSVTVEGSAR